MSADTRSTRKSVLWLVLVLTWFLVFVAQTQAQKPFSPEDFKLALPRIMERIDDAVLVRIPSTKPRVLDRAIDQGQMDGNTKLGPLFLVLKSSPEQEHALQTLLDQQQDKSTPNYHRWLTPDEFGAAFGVEESDLQQISDWLTAHRFSVDNVARGRRSIMFSGTAAEVEETFHTEMHNYLVLGKRHISNSTDISIPETVSSVVAGVASLNDFKPKARQTRGHSAELRLDSQRAQPTLTDGSGNHYVTPGDFAIIYGTQQLLAGQIGSFGNIDGNAQTIGIVGLSDINVNDNVTFRQIFLPSYNANNVNVIPFSNSNCNDPGFVNTLTSDWEKEADTDIEWAGAVAPRATIAYVPCDQLTTAAEYLVQSNIASVMSMSAESCEANMAQEYNTQTYNQFFFDLWEQAAAQGVTVFVAAGDNGSAACDTFGDNVSLASLGYAVNAFASTPYNVAVGGTMFNENGNSNYWSTTNYSTAISNLPFTSALSYIPERVWNESSVAGDVVNVLAGSGGVSACYPKPPWQMGPGVPTSDPPIPLPSIAGCPNVAGQHRYLPDVSLTAASHDAYALCDSDDGNGCQNSSLFGLSAGTTGGTSVASPAFAGIQALIDEQYSRQGQANYVYYGLANSQTSPDYVFNDVTTGSNGVPCLVGSRDPDCPSTGWLQYFAATPGYDLATGVGSVNALNLFQQWDNAVFRSTTTTLQVTNPAGGTANFGQAVTLTASVYVPSSQTSSQEWGPPLAGWTVAFWDASNSTQLGTATLTYSASTGDFVATFSTSSLSVGVHSITATFPGNLSSIYYGTSTSAPVTVTVQQQAPATGTIQVNATLNGSAWLGSVSYQLVGPSTQNGSSVPATFSSVTAGTYSFNYSSGGPSGATLSSVTPAVTQTLSSGGTITYTLNFTSPTSGTIQVNATLNGTAWTGPVSYQLFGPSTFDGTSVPATFSNAPAGSYGFNYSGGGPSGATLASVTPGVTQTLISGTTITYTMNFTASGGVVPPPAPTNLTPANGATGVSLAPTLSWSAASGATSYGLYFGLANPPYGYGTTTQTSFSPGPLGGNVTYYWQVVAVNSAGSSSSPIYSFITTLAPSGGPVLVSGLSNPTSIAVDDLNVYWTEFGGLIRSVPKSGGTPTTLYTSGYNPSGVASDGSTVFFGDGLNVRSLPRGGGQSTVLANSNPLRIAVDSANVYWTDFNAGAVRSVPKNSGTMNTLATGSNSPAGIVTDGSFVYWSELSNPGAVRKVPVNGGTVTLLGYNVNNYGIGIDSNNVYWGENVTPNAGSIDKEAKAGGTLSYLATGLPYIHDVTTDGTSVFWIQNGSNPNALSQVPITGGSPVTLATNLPDPVALAVDSTYVYWIDRNGGGTGAGTLNRVAKANLPVPIQVTVGTNVAGLPFTVDGIAYTTQQTFTWSAGSSHTLAAPANVYEGSTQYTWQGWSDSGAASHSVAPTASTTYTATYSTQYLLTTVANAGGTATPATGWYNSGQSVALSASPNTGFVFSGWQGSGPGSYSGPASQATVVMNGPIIETASFINATYTISGQATLNGSGLGGVAVTLSGSSTGSATTNGSGNYSFTVNAGGSYTVTPSLSNYTFSPSSATFSSLSGNQTANFTASLSRTAVSLSATSLSFGIQLVGSSSLKTVTLTNLGSTPLSISGLSVVGIAPLTPLGTKAGDFAIQSSSCVAGGSVAGLGSCTMNLMFEPTGAGVRSATLVISDSDPSSPQTVDLRGMGMAVWLSATFPQVRPTARGHHQRPKDCHADQPGQHAAAH